ncbi:MAG: VWA domain-containing protein [Acidobacteriota bacterium]|nr:VWA domain-containing protein [Acidobacteriota bacterium]
MISILQTGPARRRPRLGGLLGTAALLSTALLAPDLALSSAAFAQAPAGTPPEAAKSSPVTVTLDSPNAFQPAFGEVVIDAVAVSEQPVERVVFYVDGLVVGETREPPHRLTVDLGDDVDSHRFEVLAYGADGTTGRAVMTTPGMRVDAEISVQLQQLYVTVTVDGERGQDLQAEDFVVLDEDKPQTLVTFARGDIPFTAVVLLDSSSSMAGGKLQSALQGARTFFDGMQRLDEGKLVVFSDRVLHSTPFTTFPEVLSAGLGRVRAEGGTALNDHLYVSLKQLEQRQGRRVVVLLSDGVDSHSVLAMDDVLRLARRSQALIYWLRLPYRDGATAGSPPALTTPWRNSESYAQEFEILGETVAESGGRILDLASVAQVSEAFSEILAELREQYVLGYYPTRSLKDGSWREVEVRVRRPKAEIRSRGGYVDQ